MPADRSAVPEQDLTEPATSFAALGVPAPLVDILNEQGITAPFPVQAATLPDALAGRDILGRAQTGSGKTLGFSLPLVSRLTGGSTGSGRPRGLVLVPTRELATQVTTVLRPLARAMGLRVATIYGGVSYSPQVNALQHKTDIVVATPGRLADLIGQGECDLADVQITVVDEADQMSDLGFLPIVRRLLETTPDDGQRMLFSATLDAAVDVLARRFLSDPVLHSVDENSSPAEIEHYVFTVEAAGLRVAVIAALTGGDKRSLVFTRTKHGAERTARQLTEAGIPAAELHGNLRQGARSRNLDAFASGLARVMVATDIAARGIHVDGIDLVVHADPPAEHKAYVHRSGRTARGGADGVVVTLQTKSQVRDVTAMMSKAGITPHPVVTVDAGSGVLAELAGPPARRVTVAGKVAELVQPEDRLARNDRPGVGRPWEGRPRGDRRPRDDRFVGRGPRPASPRGSGPRVHDESAPVTGARPGRSERPGTVRRGDGDDRPARFERSERGDRGGYGERNDRFTGSERGGQFSRDGHGDRGFNRDNRSDRGFNRDDRSNRGFNRDDRGDRYNRSDHAGRDDRGGQFSRDGQGDRRFQPGDRNDRGQRLDRAERPVRNDRAAPASRGSNDWWPRPSARQAEGGYRQAEGGYRRPDSYRDGRPYRDDSRARDTRGTRDGRPVRDYQPGRDDRPVRDDRAQREDRPERAGRPQPGGRSQSSGRFQPGGQAPRPRTGRYGRPQAGGPASGSSRRPGYSAGRGAAGKRRG
jgi:superfamily II DNA/RNA helicase